LLFLRWLAVGLVIPIQVLLPLSRGLTLGQVGLVFSAQGFVVLFLELPTGGLTDSWGRRPVLLGGLGVYVAGTLLCGMAPSLGVFLAGRMLQAAGASAAPVVARAMLRDVQVPGAGTRAMIWISIAMAAAPALGPPLGGLIQQGLGWRWTFWALALAGVAMGAAALLRLDETLAPGARVRQRGLVRRYAGLLRDGAYCRNVGALSCLFAGLGVFFAVGPFIFIGMLGYSPVGYGVLNLVNVAGYLGGSVVAGRLSRRAAPAALVQGGTLVALAGGAAMVALAGAGVFAAWPVLAPVVVLTLGFGLVLPAGTAGALDRHPAQAGLASALLGFMQIGAAAAGTAVAGLLLGRGILPVACLFLALAAAAAWFACGLRPGVAARAA